MESKQYTSGETVPLSGIYTVTHAEHRLPHQVTLLQGQAFPSCSKCGNEVRFEIARTVSGLNDRREQILLYSLPEVPDEVPDKSTNSNGYTSPPLKKHKPRAKAHRKGGKP